MRQCPVPGRTPAGSASPARPWQNDYIARTYDRVNLTMPKGKKEIIQEKAEAQGESVNAYINKAIDQRIEREAGE